MWGSRAVSPKVGQWQGVFSRSTFPIPSTQLWLAWDDLIMRQLALEFREWPLSWLVASADLQGHGAAAGGPDGVQGQRQCPPPAGPALLCPEAPPACPGCHQHGHHRAPREFQVSSPGTLPGWELAGGWLVTEAHGEMKREQPVGRLLAVMPCPGLCMSPVGTPNLHILIPRRGFQLWLA